VTYSWVLAQEAYGLFYSEEFPEAVRVARHAQTVAPKTPCVGAVLAAALEARALGVLGRADETRAALREAEAILLGLDDATVAASAFGYDEAQLRFHEGNALTHLGDAKAAWKAQERALALVPAADFMDRALTRLDRAVCLARDGDASAAALEALDTLTGLSPEQRRGIISRRAEQVVARLPGPRGAPPPARELRDLLMLPASTEC
jgi:tetratricopeptide (TPR) repeat protein